jgi:hypothetical protein
MELDEMIKDYIEEQYPEITDEVSYKIEKEVIVFWNNKAIGEIDRISVAEIKEIFAFVDEDKEEIQ